MHIVERLSNFDHSPGYLQCSFLVRPVREARALTLSLLILAFQHQQRLPSIACCRLCFFMNPLGAAAPNKHYLIRRGRGGRLLGGSVCRSCPGVSLLGPRSWGHDEVWSRGRKVSMGPQAFANAKRVIAEDASYSQSKKRCYCFGQVGSGILAVRFTYRGGIIRIIGAAYWRRGRKIDERQGSLHKRAIGHRVRGGGLPPPAPEDLVFKEENVKVTMSLRKSSVEFFKARPRSIIPPIRR